MSHTLKNVTRNCSNENFLILGLTAENCVAHHNVLGENSQISYLGPTLVPGILRLAQGMDTALQRAAACQGLYVTRAVPPPLPAFEWY